jgi:hypothetical protein
MLLAQGHRNPWTLDRPTNRKIAYHRLIIIVLVDLLSAEGSLFMVYRAEISILLEGLIVQSRDFLSTAELLDSFPVLRMHLCGQ